MLSIIGAKISAKTQNGDEIIFKENSAYFISENAEFEMTYKEIFEILEKEIKIENFRLTQN